MTFDEEIEIPCRASEEELECLLLSVEKTRPEEDEDDCCCRMATDEYGLPIVEEDAHRPPDLNAAVLTFSARLLMYVIKKCDGNAAKAYKRSGISRQHYSKLVSCNDAMPNRITVMQFCIGLQLDLEESELLMNAAGYIFRDHISEDCIFKYCIEHKIWNIQDVDYAFQKSNLRSFL